MADGLALLEAAYDPTVTSDQRLCNQAKAAAITFVAREPVKVVDAS